MADEPALAVAGLGHNYGKFRALEAVEFTVARGAFTVLLGNNGAGKTTLFSLLTGLYHARDGRVAVCGHDLRSEPSRALRLLGVVFQQRSLDNDLTVWQNLRYSANLYGMSARAARARAEEETERLGVRERMHDKIRNLSGGQARRVEIARALMHRPELLILDEPTFGLDVSGRDALIEHVRGLCARGLSALWTTHLLDEVRPDDELLVLKSGRLARAGRAGAVAAVADAAPMRRALAGLL